VTAAPMVHVPDRNGAPLTAEPASEGGAGWAPQNVAPPPVTRDSIFGDTYGGVPNPQIPFQHAYPTRYHGPVFRMAQPGYTYARRPYALPGFLGLKGLGRAGLGKAALGALREPVTGSLLADAAVGAAVGFLGAPRREAALAYAVAGLAAGGLLGTVGLVGLLAFELYQAQRQAGLRPELHGQT
jgi:hypothetical protein